MTTIVGSSKWPAKRVRETFIEFFVRKNHVNWKSSPVVPHDDPTLLFVNAGMNQFKSILLGTVDPNTALGKLRRACNSQKCIRAGGKHNDLDDVGNDTYHHTFFEMLGTWSFADDHYKPKAIKWAWELLTEVYKLPKDQIYVTYFGGDHLLPPDDEAKNLWLTLLPAKHVLPFGCKDNFWEMGDTGPCGPCTEIHFDRMGNRGNVGHLVNTDDPTVIEIWNLVFIQFNRESDGTLKPLPANHVDTGMGLERLTCILQEKESNYDTDLFLPIIKAIQEAAGAPPYTGKVGSDDVHGVDMAYRVVADHIRTLSIAIGDGSFPGGEGREYVLRRILRRAVRYGTQVLKADKDFFNGLVKVVVEVMGDVFPELKQYQEHIVDTIASEEISFGRTLLKGIVKFIKAAKDVDREAAKDVDREAAKDVDREAAKDVRGILSGHDAFLLWDTYGFPLDLTQIMAKEKDLKVDVDGFNNVMNEARKRSRNAQSKHAGKTIALNADATSALQLKGILSTNDTYKFTWKDHRSVIKAIYSGIEFLEEIAVGDEVGIILESTSFYAEQGGQIFDSGVLEGPFGTFQVSNVQTFGGFIVHIGYLMEDADRLWVGGMVNCKVDYTRRKLIAPNHTCTHMLNFALREVLGDHVGQKGSIVLPEKLRFDFSHGEPITTEELSKIEFIVNEQIKAELDVYSEEVDLADARHINGLRTVSGEVYPDLVRIVAIGRKVEDLLANPENKEWSSISAELCGGTHISNTREAEVFAILSEEGIAKGIRRVTAVTTGSAFKALKLASALEIEVNEASKAKEDLLEQKVTSLKGRVESAPIPAAKKTNLKAKISELQNQVIKAKKKTTEENTEKAIEDVTKQAESVCSEGKLFCIARANVGSDNTAIREAVVRVMKQKGIAAMVFSTDGRKTLICAGVPEKYARQLNVVEWLKIALKPLNGKGGGGKGGIAQGQGSVIPNMEDAMKDAEIYGNQKLEGR